MVMQAAAFTCAPKLQIDCVKVAGHESFSQVLTGNTTSSQSQECKRLHLPADRHLPCADHSSTSDFAVRTTTMSPEDPRRGVGQRAEMAAVTLRSNEKAQLGLHRSPSGDRGSG